LQHITGKISGSSLEKGAPGGESAAIRFRGSGYKKEKHVFVSGSSTERPHFPRDARHPPRKELRKEEDLDLSWGREGRSMLFGNSTGRTWEEEACGNTEKGEANLHFVKGSVEELDSRPKGKGISFEEKGFQDSEKDDERSMITETGAKSPN